MGNSFIINLDDKPYLSKLKEENVQAFKDIVGTFVRLMETAAAKKWYQLPEAIHSSLSFEDIVTGVLNAVMTTEEIEPAAYAALERDLHPLALLSDKRKDIVTGEQVEYDWRKHFALDSNEVSRETVEKIIRKILYLVRWFDVESVSKQLLTREFPVVDTKDIQKLPFQPALMHQKNHLSELHVGKFFHELGAFNCGEIDKEVETCPACKIGKLEEIKGIKVCPRCNAGFKVREELAF